MTVIGDNRAVQIQPEPVLHSGTVDLGDESAGGGKLCSIEPNPRRMYWVAPHATDIPTVTTRKLRPKCQSGWKYPVSSWRKLEDNISVRLRIFTSILHPVLATRDRPAGTIIPEPSEDGSRTARIDDPKMSRYPNQTDRPKSCWVPVRCRPTYL